MFCLLSVFQIKLARVYFGARLIEVPNELKLFIYFSYCKKIDFNSLAEFFRALSFIINFINVREGHLILNYLISLSLRMEKISSVRRAFGECLGIERR